MTIKLAHFANFCPHSNGMVSTVIDLIKAERLAGYEAEFIDWGGPQQYGQQCSRSGLSWRGITTKSPDWAIDHADILVLHSALPQKVKDTGKPIIVTMHGRPEYSFELERAKRGSCLSLYHAFNKDPQAKAFISFWQEHIPQWKLMLEEETDIFYVPAMVDLDFFKPEGKKFNFGDKNGNPNIILMDIWREDLTPFNCLQACAQFIKNYCPTGKVHIFGLSKPNETPAFGNILNPLQKKGIIGHIHGLVPFVDEVYRAADFMVTPQVIATRTVREALASGCPIVGGKGNKYTEYSANPADIDDMVAKIRALHNYLNSGGEYNPRSIAKSCFSIKHTVKYIKPIIEYVISKPEIVKPEFKKPDFKIHNFIAYSTEKDIGTEYNDYMELIPDNDWACFIDHDAMFTTSDWYLQLYDIIRDNPEYSCFTAVTNRIGNPNQKFAGIDQNNHDIMYHRNIGKKAQQQYRTDVKDMADVKQLMSGVVMLVKKSAWKKVGGFKKGFLGVDNYFHDSLNKEGLKTGLMKGVYVYHLYRANNDTGLKPIGDKKDEK